MRKGKFESAPRPRRKGSKAAALILAAGLLVGVVVGGTVAWLTAQSKQANNTFTPSNIKITLDETTGEDYKMIPGWTIDKDPKVTVEKGSEDCWVFIKVVEKGATVNGTTYSLRDFITYSIDSNNWAPLHDSDNDGIADNGIYYTKYEKRDDIDIAIKVLKDNQVMVKDTVTKEMMEALTGENYPTLTFTAYASQLYKSNNEMFTAEEAWKNVPQP